MRNLRPLGYALLVLAIVLVSWGLFRQVDPIEHPVTFTGYVAVIVLASVLGFIFTSDWHRVHRAPGLLAGKPVP